MSIFWYVGFFLLALAVLIVVHELGHFLVARACGVKVLRFAVGFGKPIFMRRYGPDQTEWAVCAVPLGGYVRMLDEREAPVAPADVARAFNRQTVGKRIAIVAAGPAANFLLAIAIYWAVFMSGVAELRPVLDAPAPGTAAATAGLARGEQVLKVGGLKVSTWQQMRLAVLEQALDARSTELEIADPSGQTRVVTLDLTAVDRDHLERDFLGDLGVVAERVRLAPVVGQVVPGSPADTAGLLKGDTVVALDDLPIQHWGEVVTTIREAAGRTLKVDYLRNGTLGQLMVRVPEVMENGRKIGRIGIGPQPPAEGAKNLTISRYGPVDAMHNAFLMTWDTTRLSLSVMWKMVWGEVSWRNLSGPVAIADYAGRTAAMGVDTYIRFIALVSISLGVVNLLPIPVLDGGHLMYYFAEIIKGSPVSEQAMVLGQKIGFALLMMLMVFALYNDINRLFFG